MDLFTVILAVRRAPQQPHCVLLSDRIRFGGQPRPIALPSRCAPTWRTYQLLSVILSLVMITFSGCASIRESVRSLWRPGSSEQMANAPSDVNENTAKKLQPEPAVAANVALGSDSAQELTASHNGKNDARVKSIEGQNDAPQAVSDARAIDVAVRSNSKNAARPILQPFVEIENDDVSMERLTAALSDDGLSSDPLPQRSLTSLDDQVRIEALMAQANRLLDNGQLEKARQKAQRAQDISEGIQIDYAPDEERPIDLVRRIQGQLQATRLHDESLPDHRIANSPDSPIEQDSPDVAVKESKPAPATSKEASSLARLRRDWSTLFRREKKTSPQESVPADENLDPAPLPPVTAPALNQQASRTIESDERDAIVMANRSVSLGTVELSTDSSLTIETDVEESSVVRMESIQPEQRGFVEAEIPGLQDLRENATSDLFETSKTNFNTDDAAEAPTDIDPADVAISFSEAKSLNTERTESAASEPKDVSRQSDWTGLYIGFGLCLVLAIACYRRGAV